MLIEQYIRTCDNLPIPVGTFEYVDHVRQFYYLFLQNPNDESLGDFPLPEQNTLDGRATSTRLICAIGACINGYKENQNPEFIERLQTVRDDVEEHLNRAPIVNAISRTVYSRIAEMVDNDVETFVTEQKTKLTEIWKAYKSKIPAKDMEQSELIMSEINEKYGKDFVGQNYVILTHMVNEGTYWTHAVDKYYNYYTRVRLTDECPPVHELQAQYIPFLYREDAKHKKYRISETKLNEMKLLFSEAYRKAIVENKERKKQFQEEAIAAEERRSVKREEAAERLKQSKNARRRARLRQALLEAQISEQDQVASE